MNSPLQLRLPTALKTRFAGVSLAESLYSFPVTLLLTGDLGAGKTTFMQGFAEKLGISEPLTSPTYALEQRYRTGKGTPLYHLDLYRLKERDAVELVESTEDHAGIRCIEWADRLPERMNERSSIHLHFEEDGAGRLLTIHWNDHHVPTEKQIEDWRAEAMTPPHIVRHCETVARVAGGYADTLLKEGKIIRKDALIAAARLHDLLRFVDFKTEAPAGVIITEEEKQTWNRWKETYAGLTHETAAADFLVKQGFPLVAAVIRTHGLNMPFPDIETIEQKILFYADKRCMMDQIVTVDERFADFRVRYTNGEKSALHDTWYANTKKIAEELFPETTPEF